MAGQGKKKLILIPSESMDKNKKSDRNENGLIRMASKTRNFLGFTDDKVEIWTAGSGDRNASVLLNIFKAFSTDVALLKKMIRTGELTENEMNRVGFVTTKMYNRITGGDSDKNVWVSTGVHDTVIGADPEFLIFDSDGNIINAGSRMSKSGIIGSDGAMAEVRPAPATSADGVVSNIRKAFQDESLTERIRQFDWMCSCYHRTSSRDYPVGGHIHVGNPARVTKIPMTEREIYFNVLNKIMDELLAVPCIRLDGEMGRKRRTECQMSLGNSNLANGTTGWGWFGEWRFCNGRLEHRSLSGMWLMHPSVAKAVLGTAKAITDAFFKYWAQHGFDGSYIIPDKYKTNKDRMNANGYSNWKYFPVCKDMGATMGSTELRRALNESKGGDITKAYLRSWLDNMKKLETYTKYSKYIRGLREILKINMNELSSWDRKIQNNWCKSKKFLVDL